MWRQKTLLRTSILQVYRYNGRPDLRGPHAEVRAVLRRGLHPLSDAARHGKERKEVLQLELCCDGNFIIIDPGEIGGGGPEGIICHAIYLS